jgi:predicted nuclease of restriction endonuclease-like (RecB) superfamily
VSASTERFPLTWSHDVRLLSVENAYDCPFSEAEAIRGRWSSRQINSMFHERTTLSWNKAAMLTKGQLKTLGMTSRAAS